MTGSPFCIAFKMTRDIPVVLIVAVCFFTCLVLYYTTPLERALSRRPLPADLITQLCGGSALAKRGGSGGASGAATAIAATASGGLRSDLTIAPSLAMHSCSVRMRDYYHAKKQAFYADPGNDKLRCFLVEEMELPKGPVVVVDVGANKGRYFSEPCRLNARRKRVSDGFGSSARLIMVEANPRAVPVLQAACGAYASCRLVQAAATYAHGGQTMFNTGRTTEVAEREIVSVVGSLNDLGKVYPKEWDDAERYSVNLTTINQIFIDEVRVHGQSADTPIEYMKTDTEGHDGFVLWAADEVLPRVRFLTYECHHLMRPANMTLYETANYLANFGFMSFIVSPSQLIRVDGPFYQPLYDNELQWQNCVAFREDHPLASRIFDNFNEIDDCKDTMRQFVR